jgi:hypothetical protein
VFYTTEFPRLVHGGIVCTTPERIYFLMNFFHRTIAPPGGSKLKTIVLTGESVVRLVGCEYHWLSLKEPFYPTESVFLAHTYGLLHGDFFTISLSSYDEPGYKVLN